MGEIRLPYYDPMRRRYEVARARLGSVTVKPASSPLASESADEDATPGVDLGELVAPRRTLDRAAAGRSYLTESASLWVLLFATPFSVALGAIATSLGRRFSEDRKLKKRAPETRAKAATKQAAQALQSADMSGAIAAVERALYLGIEAATFVKGRALVRTELEAHLLQAGLSEALARESCTLLEQCDTVRFLGGSEEGVRSLVLQVAPLVRRLVAAGAKRGSANQGDEVVS